jgi:hypothetical protein
VRRLAPALLLLPILAGGCSDLVERFPCPGTPLATMAFTATRTEVSCAETNSVYPATVKFTGTISQSASDDSAALCSIRPKAEPLVGTLVSDLLDVSLDTRGALLGSCDPRCAVTVTQQVSGTLARGPGGAAIGFAGTLVDTATLDGTVSGASCSPCLVPCHATYLVTGLTP